MLSQLLPRTIRRDFLLYVDEFQSFLGISGPFADALAQARGLRLSLTLANQHLGQLPRDIRDAVAANARNRVVFGCSPSDASTLAQELMPLEPQALVSMRPFEAAARLMSGAEALTVRLLPPVPRAATAARAGEVLAASSSRFGRDVASVDADLAELVTTPEGAQETPTESTD